MIHLGEKNDSILFPFVINFLVIFLSEVYAYGIAKNPMIVGAYIIFINVFLIIYFAFREGIKGGLISIFFSIAYYFYIIFTRHYTGEQLSSGITTTIILTLLYLFLGSIIGWLKEQIDKLIEIQTDERKRLETIIQQLPIGAVITDETGRVTHINKQIAKILGSAVPVGYILGEKTMESVRIDGKKHDPKDTPTFNVLATKKPIVNRELLYEDEKRGKVYLRVDSSPIFNSRKKIIAVATTISDITAQKKHEQQKDDFVAMISHELRTPLTSAKLYVQHLLTSQNENPTTLTVMGKINNQIDKLTTLVNTMLDTVRLEQGKHVDTKEVLILKEVVLPTVNTLKEITNRNITVNWQTREYFYGNSEKISQVLTNLVTNAIKFSPKKSEIIIASHKKNGSVVVSVQDFGIGLSQNEQKHVFDRFYQSKEHKTYPGLGLGLYLCTQIIKQHKGKIWVESEKGKGSRFYFSLPIYNGKKIIL